MRDNRERAACILPSHGIATLHILYSESERRGPLSTQLGALTATRLKTLARRAGGGPGPIFDKRGYGAERARSVRARVDGEGRGRGVEGRGDGERADERARLGERAADGASEEGTLRSFSVHFWRRRFAR